jgi:hypothetical protein
MTSLLRKRCVARRVLSNLSLTHRFFQAQIKKENVSYPHCSHVDQSETDVQLFIRNGLRTVRSLQTAFPCSFFPLSIIIKSRCIILLQESLDTYGWMTCVRTSFRELDSASWRSRSSVLRKGWLLETSRRNRQNVVTNHVVKLSTPV